MDNVRLSPDHQLIGRFRKKSLFFRDTRKVQEHDAKVRLSIPLTSPENSVAEIIPLKENRPKELYCFFDITAIAFSTCSKVTPSLLFPLTRTA